MTGGRLRTVLTWTAMRLVVVCRPPQSIPPLSETETVIV
jgi:hypothetical protein